MNPPIDLNADLGEGFGRWRLGDDEGLLDVVTSANVACGFHAGDPSIMRRVCVAAVARGVRIGAQVGYRDLAGFGRRAMEYDPAELTADVLYQLGALDGFARAAGDRVRYVKPHGALYNVAAHDTTVARVVAEAVRKVNPSLVLLGLAGSTMIHEAEQAGLTVACEAFADRAYLANGTLLPRDRAGAVLHDEQLVANQALTIARDNYVLTIDRVRLEVKADSLCIHGDNPAALALVKATKRALEAEGFGIRSFV